MLQFGRAVRRHLRSLTSVINKFPIPAEMYFIQNQLQTNILFQLLRICKFIASWIKFTESISFHIFSHLNLNIVPYGSIRVAQPKNAAEGWREEKNLILEVLAESAMM